MGEFEVKFDGYKLVLELEAQMPMIHFQSDQCGATLRATEMKPKLDAFLLMLLGKEAQMSVKELKKSQEYGMLFLNKDADNNDALDYKLQIVTEEVPTEIDLDKVTKRQDGNGKWKTDNSENYTLFYANMGKKDDAEKAYGIFSNPTVTILCFKEKLRQLIRENIINFFLVTNFGTMQNKGFGSFAPKLWLERNGLSDKKKREVAMAYRELIPDGKCYAMTYKNVLKENVPLAEKNKFCVELAELIKSFYSIMKSGINFNGYSRSYIYQYGHEVLQLGNEKAWMKKNKLAPIVCKPGNEKKHEYGTQEHRYLRAFLGVGENIEYGNRLEDGKLKKDNAIKIGIKSKEFERLPSPIYFKVIQNVVFVVAFDVPEEIYGASFTFSSTMSGGTKTICVPKREELETDGKFDIQDFLSKYVAYYNGELRTKVWDMQKDKKKVKYPEALEVKINA